MMHKLQIMDIIFRQIAMVVSGQNVAKILKADERCLCSETVGSPSLNFVFSSVVEMT